MIKRLRLQALLCKTSHINQATWVIGRQLPAPSHKNFNGAISCRRVLQNNCVAAHDYSIEEIPPRQLLAPKYLHRMFHASKYLDPPALQQSHEAGNSAKYAPGFVQTYSQARTTGPAIKLPDLEVNASDLQVLLPSA